MMIQLYPDQEHALRILAAARKTTIEGVAATLLNQGIAEALSDDAVVTAAQTYDWERLDRFLKRVPPKTVWSRP